MHPLLFAGTPKVRGGLLCGWPVSLGVWSPAGCDLGNSQFKATLKLNHPQDMDAIEAADWRGCESLVPEFHCGWATHGPGHAVKPFTPLLPRSQPGLQKLSSSLETGPLPLSRLLLGSSGCRTWSAEGSASSWGQCGLRLGVGGFGHTRNSSGLGAGW